MNTVAVLQARVSSSRLPNKVLLPILNVPMLARQIERVATAKKINKLVVATSDQADDEAIKRLCDSLGVACFRGSLDDVLDRFFQAAKHFQADNVVRLTGDCPLADPEVIDAVIDHHIRCCADYTSNCCPPTFPDGLDVEVLTIQALEKSWRSAKLSSEREHVTQYVRKASNGFVLANYESLDDLSSMRWTVDELRDFEFVTKVYEKLYPLNSAFNTHDILGLLQREPEIGTLNSMFERNEGLSRSLLNDIVGSSGGL
jgi:spore coat polysaccharide biosynthesis protein SpsF